MKIVSILCKQISILPLSNTLPKVFEVAGGRGIIQLNPPLLARTIRLIPLDINGSNAGTQLGLQGCPIISMNYSFSHVYNSSGRYQVKVTGLNKVGNTSATMTHTIVQLPVGISHQFPNGIVYKMDTAFQFRVIEAAFITFYARLGEYLLPVNFSSDSLTGTITIPTDSYDQVGTYELKLYCDTTLTNPFIVVQHYIQIANVVNGLAIYPAILLLNVNEALILNVSIQTATIFNFTIDWNDSTVDYGSFLEVTTLHVSSYYITDSTGN